MTKNAIYNGPDPAFRGVAGYATPSQCDSDVWLFECAGRRCVALQSELRFTTPSDLADPTATDYATLGESLEWPLLLLVVGALVSVAWAVIAYGWLAALRFAVGAACIIVVSLVARKS